MAHHTAIQLTQVSLAAMYSRRAILMRGVAMGITLAGGRQHIAAFAAPTGTTVPTVTVAPPTITRQWNCTATVSAPVTIAGIAPGLRYEVYGDILDADEPDGEPDLCGKLMAQETETSSGASQILHLTQQVMAADLGLIKGIGPASDEVFSPDLVELFARIWLRNVVSGVEYGPWQSPPRIVVASGALAWTPDAQHPGNVLMTPRRRVVATPKSGSATDLPPLACIP